LTGSREEGSVWGLFECTQCFPKTFADDQGQSVKGRIYWLSVGESTCCIR
jgi:hypothetical protein